jgi:hypothetical protein
VYAIVAFPLVDPLKGEMLRILHPDGRCEEKLKPDLTDDTAQALYRQMVVIRQADQRAVIDHLEDPDLILLEA